MSRLSRKLERVNTNLRPGISCQQASAAPRASAVAKEAGQPGKLLAQIQLTAGSGEVLASSLAPFTVRCPPGHQKDWGSPPVWLELFSSP